MVAPPLITLSSIVFQVMSNGPPNGPDPPWTSIPPSIVEKWICTDAAFVPWTPPEIVAVWTGWSSLPNTSVAPGSTNSPPRIVTGPALKHVPPAGTTTFPYVPAASTPAHVVVLPAAPATPAVASAQP